MQGRAAFAYLLAAACGSGRGDGADCAAAGSDGGGRLIGGRSCWYQARIGRPFPPSVVAGARVAISDFTGVATAEIVAARSEGGLVVFTRRANGWEVLWEPTSTFADQLCDWAGPS